MKAKFPLVYYSSVINTSLLHVCYYRLKDNKLKVIMRCRRICMDICLICRWNNMKSHLPIFMHVNENSSVKVAFSNLTHWWLSWCISFIITVCFTRKTRWWLFLYRRENVLDTKWRYHCLISAAGTEEIPRNNTSTDSVSKFISWAQPTT